MNLTINIPRGGMTAYCKELLAANFGWRLATDDHLLVAGCKEPTLLVGLAHHVVARTPAKFARLFVALSDVRVCGAINGEALLAAWCDDRFCCDAAGKAYCGHNCKRSYFDGHKSTFEHAFPCL